MKKLFVPDMYIEEYSKLNITKLKHLGIKVLMCDIDNTLAAFDEESMSSKAKAFVNEIKESGLDLILISNNTTKRVSKFCEGVDVEFVANSLKPLPHVFQQLKKEYGVSYQEMALLGDQLLTDISGAKNLGIYAILTNPLVARDINFTKVNRIIERYLFKRLAKKGYLIKGVYYE